MKLLILTSEPITSAQLRGVLGGDLDPSEVEVMVVAPALQQSPFKFWMSDADDAIAKAREVSQTTVEQLGEDGIAASGDTGESDPYRAVQDALQTFDAERIVVFTHPEGAQAYREDVDVTELQQRFGRPVERAAVSG
jgi:hypothetical protein